MIKIENFKPEHLSLFIPRDILYQENWEKFSEEMRLNGESGMIDIITLVRGKAVVAFAGLVHQRNGVAEGAIIPGVLVDSYKKEFFIAIHGLVTQFVPKVFGIHRLEIAISNDWEAGDKWARKLGFKFEGIARAWSQDKKDHSIYARVEV